MIYCKYHNKTEDNSNFSISPLGKRYVSCDVSRALRKEYYQGGGETRVKPVYEPVINPQFCYSCDRDHEREEFKIKKNGEYYASCNKVRAKQKMYRDKRKESK